MKKVKAYIKVLDELDIIKGIFKLSAYNLTEEATVVVRFPIAQLEYEDEEHRYIYADNIIQNVFEALGFLKCELSSEYYRRGNIVLTYYRQSLENNENYLVIERIRNPESYLQEESNLGD